MRRMIIGALAALAIGCAHRSAATAPATPQPLSRLQEADRLVVAGCFDCLVAAFREYDALRQEPSTRAAAANAAVRTAALIAVRENELGFVPGGYLDRARQIVGFSPALATSDASDLVAIAEILASGPAGQLRAATDAAQLVAVVTLSRNQQRWADLLRRQIPDDLAATYLWMALACGSYGAGVPDRDDRRNVIGAAIETPLIAFKEAISCLRGDRDRVRAIADADARFKETHFFLGLAALGLQPAAGAPPSRPDLETADREFGIAYEWRQEWPALMLAIANVALTAEDFARALDFYEKTLAVSSDNPDATLGTIRALTYLERATDAIAAADRLLAIGYSPGEARYWRALNEARLRRDDEAWDDVERADSLLVNADVPKLAGTIALNRRELDVAQQKLELALTRNPSDCEVRFYLQSVLGEQRQWDLAARQAESAAACFDAEEITRRNEIASLRSADMAPDRRGRQIARREQRLAQNARMRATSWFNAAAAHFNLGDTDEAKRFVEKVVDDEQFAARAQELLRRLMP